MHCVTPLVRSVELSELSGRHVWLKLETDQLSGSFKGRGVSHLMKAAACGSYVSSSGGNAGLAAACSGRALAVPVTVVVPSTTPQFMRDRIASEGAAVIVHGNQWADADKLARQMCVDDASVGYVQYVAPHRTRHVCCVSHSPQVRSRASCYGTAMRRSSTSCANSCRMAWCRMQLWQPWEGTKSDFLRLLT